MNILYKVLSCTGLVFLAGCMSEEVSDTSQSPSTDGDNNRIEVQMTLKNRLSMQPVSKAGGIATEPENRIQSLDVYVFGSETEEGTYTFQERFAYREQGSNLPAGTTAIDLQAKGTEGTETTAILALKKGLFVKLYCIANQTDLINPGKADAGGVVSPDDFRPLELSAPDKGRVTLTADGVPTETDFLKFHTPLFVATNASDTIVTPLPMTGAYVTPVDLTDFSVSSRTQVGFRLTRMVSRFDVINKASESKLTIESISLAKGRRGSYFFPAKVYGASPANADELITYPIRNFWGEQANKGTQAGAFYSWPSPSEDGSYLILKGKYQANQTEAKEVTYQVPFKQEAADGSGSFLEISANHRYTVAITKADEYHLDVNISVSDWTDEGNVDDYDPDVTQSTFKVDIVQANGDYDGTSNSVNMSILDDATFDVKIAANAEIGYSLTYEKLTTTAPWLKVEAITTRASQEFGFKVSRNKDYHGNEFPVAYLRFTNNASGEESLLIIRPVATPVVKLLSASTNCSFNEQTGEMTLYKDETSGKTSVTLNIFSTGGCKLADTSNAGALPDWIERDKDALTDANGNIKFTLNTDAASFPAILPDGYSFDVVNVKNEDKKQTVKVKIKTVTTVQQSAVTVADGGAFDAANSRMRLYNNTNDKVTLKVFALNGSEVTGVPGWLTLDKSESSNDTDTYTFYVANNASTGGNATITVKSKFDNTLLKTFTVYAINKDVVLSDFSASQSSYTTIDNINATKPNITFFPSANAYFTIKATSPKGLKSITCHDNWRWMLYPTVSSTTTDPNTGVVTTIYRFTRSTSPATNRDVDEFFSTPTGDENITLTNNYSGGTSTKAFAIKHTVPVYPGSTVAPQVATGSSKNYWVAPVNAKGSCLFKDKGDCPTHWKIPSKADCVNIFHSSQEGGTFNYVNSQAKANKYAFGEGTLFWTTDAYWYGRFLTDTYRLNSIGETDTNSVRCIQDK